MRDVIAIVPARAGSVRVPGKNRRIVDGISLAEGAMRRAMLIVGDPERVIVTTDDEFVADVAEYRGHPIVFRSPDLAGSEVTIAETVDHAVSSVVSNPSTVTVAVLQPTSPLLSDQTVIEAFAEFTVHTEWESLALAVEDRHLSWYESSSGTLTPNFEQRVNAQYRADRVWRETGGLMLVRSWTGPGSLVSDAHHLYPIDEEESLDVDTPLDLVVANAAAARSTIEWRLIAGNSVGYGHVYRSLALAAELPHHEHRWIVDDASRALEIIGDDRDVLTVGDEYDDPADLVVFDSLQILDHEYRNARAAGSLVAGIEIVEASDDVRLDLYVDELGTRVPSPLVERARHSALGPAYASLRDEFRAARVALETGIVEHLAIPGRVLVTFGGEDPRHMTANVVEALVDRYDVRAIIGPGFDRTYVAMLRDLYGSAIVARGRMSREMLAAQVVVTSTGRTVWEAAALGASTITIPVNDRERDHAFPSQARRIPAEQADAATVRLLVDYALADDQSLEARCERAIASGVDGYGPRRVAYLIDGLLGGNL